MNVIQAGKGLAHAFCRPADGLFLSVFVRLREMLNIGSLSERKAVIMAHCEYCGTLVLFGGFSSDPFCACCDYCRRQIEFREVGERISDDLVLQYTKQIHQSACPRCHRPGPVDMHSYFYIFSVMVLTIRRTVQIICCRRCAVKRQIGGLIFSSIAGWWGMPFGLIFTPVQIYSNLAWLLDPPDPSRPSSWLYDYVRLRIAEQSVAAYENSSYGRQG